MNIDKYYDDKLKQIENEKNNDAIENYNNNYEYKVSLLNIDSRNRNKTPKNIIDSQPIYLENNPLYLTKNSSIVKIKYNNHNLNTGDEIILRNVVNTEYIYNKNLYLLSGFDYLIVNYNNHNLIKNDNYTYKIKITNYEQLQYNDRLIGNIPINAIIGIHSIYILNNGNDNNINNNNINKILDNLNITRQELNANYFFIKLPFIYSNENKINTSDVFNIFHNIDKIFKFQYQHIGGVGIQYINADYPINQQQYQSSHQITNTDDNYIYINIGIKAIINSNSGGDNVVIGKIINTFEGYPNSNDYIIELKKSFTNIVRIEMVTSEIPYIDFNIYNNINNSNNKLYWKYYEDGDYIYNIQLDEGNYNPTSLISTLKSKMNDVERISSTKENKYYNLFDITFDDNSKELVFLSYKQNKLPNSLTVESDSSLGSETFKLIIKHINNFVEVGDTITISGAQRIGDIPASALNTSHTVYEINEFADTYTVLIDIVIEKSLDKINLTGTGGGNIFITIPAKVSFLFNYDDTLGNILGFKNVGYTNSITEFSNKTSNFDNYIEPILFDEVGNANPSNDIINLNGNNYYLLLYINDFEGVIVNSNLDNPFSKILLTGQSGDIMFNTFVNSPLEFDVPIASINYFKIKFLFSDGSLPDFRNFDHSFTLRIVESTTQPHRTKINPKETSYIGSMIDYYRNNNVN